MTDPVVFDVGANAGAWSERVLALSPGATVHAFEPVPASFADLRRRLGDHPRVRLNEAGIGDRDGQRTVFFAHAGDTTASTLDFQHLTGARGASAGAETCRFITPGGYLETASLTRIDLLKVDTEGTDYDVLRAFLATGATIPVIQFEFTVFSRLNRTLLRDFVDLLGQDYRIFKIFPAWVEEVQYTLATESLAYGMYLAIAKRSGFTRRVAALTP